MAKILYLVRHGKTEGSEVRRYKGSIDVPLSSEGIEQIKRVAEFINSSLLLAPSIPLTAIYSSPLSRALKSAELIAEPHGLRPVVIPDLRERSFGVWEGMSFDEIKEKYPEEFNAWAENPLKYSPPHGESTLEVKERVIRALEDILNDDQDRVAIVAHGGVNRIILCHLMGIPLENIFRIEQDYGAINIIEFHDRYPVIKLMNFSLLVAK